MSDTHRIYLKILSGPTSVRFLFCDLPLGNPKFKTLLAPSVVYKRAGTVNIDSVSRWWYAVASN